MKLYLSSYRVPVPEALFKLLPKSPTECTVAIIPNAKDYKSPQERAQSLDELIVYLGGFGFKSDVIDLRDYEDPDVLRRILQGYPMVWAAGGNTFILRSEMRRTGLDGFLRELVMNGHVYCGESAGAIVAGLSLDGAQVGDDPDLADEVILEGLGLVDRILAPHADNPENIEYINHMKQLYEDDPRVVYLRDDQAVIVDADQQVVVPARG